MGRIQSSVGLVSGIPIEDTVNQLMAVAARPRDLLTQRNQLLQAESAAIDSLASLVLAFNFESSLLKGPELYSSRSASTSDADALTASVSSGGTPAVGSYLFTPVQTAASHQLLSQSLATGQVVGAGSFDFRVGGFVDKGISLDELNSGVGVARGEIRITDRSGASDVVDLRFVRTVDDVLDAINSNTTVNVTATAVGDTFQLTDNTGQITSNLIVQEVNLGTTAASLGLDGVNVAANSATGTDVFTLHNGTKLSSLNDGSGVQLKDGDDLQITLLDNVTTLSIDLGSATTLEDVVTAINAADPAKLSAAIDGAANKIVLTDLTTDAGGTFGVTSVGTGSAAEDLGLTTTAVGDTLTSERLASGLRDSLASRLRGGQGLGTLGQVDITTRDNNSFSVDLSAATTLAEIVDAFNVQSTNVTASINASRSGILLTDDSGGTTVNFQVSDGDANDSATALGIVFDAAETTVDSGSLGRQTISATTLLSELNNGDGVKLGDVQILDSNGQIAILDLNSVGSEAETVGDVIDAINATSIGVSARINDLGDGILLIDTVSGSGTLTVAEIAGGQIAADLGILGSAVEVTLGGTPTKVIDGTSTKTVTIDADDTLDDVVKTINDLKAGVTASIVNDGSGQRLSLQVAKAGTANALQFHTSASPFTLQEVAAPRDGLLLYGSPDNVGAGILVASDSNTFNDVVSGLNLTIADATQKAVTVNVTTSTSSLTDAVQGFVDAFNSVRDNLDTVTDFDEVGLTTGILFGTTAVLRVETDLSRLLSGTFNGVGNFRSLAEVGISFDDKGKLSLDKTKLTDAFNSDPEALEQLFSDEDLGLAAKLDAVVERLAVDDTSTLTSRSSALDDTIEANTARIDAFTEQLDRQRERLLLQFFNLETIIAKFQQNVSALSSFSAVPPLGSTSS